ncbi:MAG: M55 family metallopeptidase [Chloroflexi bacterium]|nr:M55 family metallopeptidase [Chloroflexota bacterium]
MKIYLSTDFEGTSGIVAWEQAIEGNPEYAHGRALLTAEVNAAIEGARAGGATEVVVNDAHHNMRNLHADELAGEATLISGRHKPLYMMEGLDDSFDGVFFVSYHGSIGAPEAILSHTYSPNAIHAVRVNGHIAGESALNALVAAHYNVPILLVTGDRVTVDEAAWFAATAERIMVKEGLGRFAARNLHPLTARRLIGEGATRAVTALGDSARGANPAIDRPVRVEIEFLSADMAEMALAIAGVTRTEARTVVMEDDDTLSLYKRFVAIIYLTRGLFD